MYLSRRVQWPSARPWIWSIVLALSFLASHPAQAQDYYSTCAAQTTGFDNPDTNDPPHLKPITAQSGYVGEEIRLRLTWCDPENEAPGTIAANMPRGATLPDNGDGTRTFVWTPVESVETQVTFTVYEESDRSIHTSITVPFNVVDRAVSDPQPYAITLAPEIAAQNTSDIAAFSVSGRVIALTGLELPAEIIFTATDKNGLPHDLGNLPVTENGRWQGQINLLPGLNNINLSFPDGAYSVPLSVTHNPGFAFSGYLDLQPDVAYVNEPRLFTVRIALHDPRAFDSHIELIDINRSRVVATLTDDGDLVNGDEIESDGIYSTLFSVEAAIAETANYQVRVTMPDGQSAFSEPAQLLVTQRLDNTEVSQIIAQQALFEAQIAAAETGEMNTVLQQIRTELAADPRVAEVGISEGRTGLWVIYENGIAGAVYAPVAGTKGGQANNISRRETPAKLQLIDDAETPGSLDLSTPLSVNRYKPGSRQQLPYSRYCRSQVTRENNVLIDGASTAASLQTTLSTRNVGTANDNAIQSSNVLAIAAQYWDWGEFDDIPQMQQILSDDDCYDVTYKRYYAKGAGSVEDFKNLGDYGTILISSHGDSFYAGIESDWLQRFGWNGTTGQVIVDSNMQASDANRRLYEDDLHTGRLVLWGTSLGITPSFISKYSGQLPNSLVYMSICRGTWNASLASAFINNGAGSFLGYDNYVTVAFCQDTGPALLNSLLKDDQSLQQAFTPGQLDPYAPGVVEFDLFGADNLSLEAGELQDQSFEQNNLTQAWQVAGDARLIQSLGAYLPTDGTAMAVISTGLGFTTQAGSLSQPICLCNGPTQLSFDWNLLSEELMEYVGSQFQDTFTVSLVDKNDMANTAILLNESIDTVADGAGAVEHGFDQNDVYATGWRTYSGTVPASFSGKSVSLRFAVSDIGDSIFDTAVLVDNVNIYCNTPNAATQQ